MKPTMLLIVTSLVSILLLTLHLSDDMVRGFSAPGLDNLIGVAILVVYLYGALMLPERLAGYIIMFLGSLCGAGMPILHMPGARFVDTVRSDGGFFFYWTLFTLGVTGVFGMILAARGLWTLWRVRKSE